MFSTKSAAHIIKNMFAIIIALFVLATITLNAQEKGHGHDKSKGNKECTDAQMKDGKTCSDDASKEAKSCCSSTTEVKAKKASLSSSIKKPWNQVCPVLGDKVNPKVETVEYKGKVYGFCCAGCDEKFKADPEKYSSLLSKDGKKLLKN